MGAEFTACFLDSLNALLYNEFVGQNKYTNPEGVRRKQEEEAEYILNNIRLCNMCDFKAFTCQYMRFYFRLSPEKQAQYNDVFWSKIPRNWAERGRQHYDREYASNRLTAGIAGRVRALEEVLTEACKTSALHQESHAYAKACCRPDHLDLPGQFGCGPSGRRRRSRKKPSRRRYRRKKPTRRRYRFRRSNRKEPRRPRRFRRKKPTYDRRDYCPQKKPTCKCWICQEEGHYARECPNRNKKDNQEKVKVIQMAYKYELEPVESTIGSEESIFDYSESNTYDTREFSEDPGSDWTEV